MALRPSTRLVLGLVLALALPACDLDLGEEEPTVTTRVDAGIDFTVCQIADERGLDDHSYNQAIARGLRRAETYLGVDTIYREAVSAGDLEAEVESLVTRGCDLLVVPDVVGDVPEAVGETDVLVAEVETDALEAEETTADSSNLVRVGFRSEQAAYLAGYASAGATQAGAIGVVQGATEMLQRTVDAFSEGVLAFNERHGSEIELAREMVSASPELATTALARQGASLALIATTSEAETVDPAKVPESMTLVWFGENGCRALPERCDRFFTSVVNNIDNATFDVIKLGVAKALEGGTYQGDLANGGVGLAPFNSYADRVPPEVRQELIQLRDSIISGDLAVGSEPAND